MNKKEDSSTRMRGKSYVEWSSHNVLSTFSFLPSACDSFISRLGGLGAFCMASTSVSNLAKDCALLSLDEEENGGLSLDIDIEKGFEEVHRFTLVGTLITEKPIKINVLKETIATGRRLQNPQNNQWLMSDEQYEEETKNATSSVGQSEEYGLHRFELPHSSSGERACIEEKVEGEIKHGDHQLSLNQIRQTQVSAHNIAGKGKSVMESTIHNIVADKNVEVQEDGLIILDQKRKRAKDTQNSTDDMQVEQKNLENSTDDMQVEQKNLESAGTVQQARPNK
nr:hypothetical protein Iba_chr11eCG6630 [Ipomoea batatas]